jgi:hypothetical protein
MFYFIAILDQYACLHGKCIYFDLWVAPCYFILCWIFDKHDDYINRYKLGKYAKGGIRMEKKWILEEKGYFYFPVYFIIVLMLLDGIDINLGGSWLVDY